VRGQARRRWALVGGGVAALCLAPLAIGAWPVPDARADPADLRDRILASTRQPYQGYVDSSGRLGLPALPVLDEVTALVSGNTRLRAWYASPTSWRIAQLDATGERDIYRTRGDTYVWDFERDQVTHLVGELPVRLPWAADLPPPQLGRWLLRGAATGDPITSLPARRVAGVAAVGLRLTPSDPDTTVGRVDVWADPETALPLHVEVGAKGAASAVFTSRFLQLDQHAPDPEVLKPGWPDSAAHVLVYPADMTQALNGVGFTGLPSELAGRPRTTTAGPLPGAPGASGYGAGFAMFAVLTLPGRLGGRTLAAAREAGATPVPLVGAQAYELRTSVLSTLVIRTDGDRVNRRGWLLAGLVSPDLLRRAAADLVGPT